jgi:hypothetical protein
MSCSFLAFWHTLKAVENHSRPSAKNAQSETPLRKSRDGEPLVPLPETAAKMEPIFFARRLSLYWIGPRAQRLRRLRQNVMENEVPAVAAIVPETALIR